MTTDRTTPFTAPDALGPHRWRAGTGQVPRAPLPGSPRLETSSQSTKRMTGTAGDGR